jgi:hypothetical protein
MLQKILNLVFFAGMVFMNYLANALPINGKTTGQLSDQYPNLFVPAGVTFSIWGVIYLLLFIFCILQFRAENKQIIQSIGWLFIVTCVLNGLWIVAWHYEQLPLSLLIMFGLLAGLIFINIGLKDFPAGLTKAAFGIYLGWICIATIANVTALIVQYNWQGFGISQETWTIILILIGALITSLAVYRFNNLFIALSVIWAFTGIILKRQGDYKSIVMTAALAILIVLVAAAYHGFRKNLPAV